MRISFKYLVIGLAAAGMMNGCALGMDEAINFEVGTAASELSVTDELGSDTTYAAAIDGLPLRQIATVTFPTVQGTQYRVSSKALILSTDTKLFWLGQVACYKGASLLDQRTDERDTQQNQQGTVLYPRLLFTGPPGGGRARVVPPKHPGIRGAEHGTRLLCGRG